MSESNLSVAILGIGFVGRPLADLLHRDGIKVMGARRHPSDLDKERPYPVIPLDISASANSDFSEWAEYTTWTCLLPPTRSKFYAEGVSGETSSNAFVDGIAAWIEAAKRYGVKHLVYSSSTSVYGDHPHVDEKSPVDPQNDSAREICAVEKLFLDSGLKDVDIIRLSGLYGPERHPIEWLKQRSLSVRPHARVNMVSQDQAAEAMKIAIMNPNGIRIRNIVDPSHLTRLEFYNKEAEALGTEPPKFDMNDTSTDGKIVDTIYDDFDVFS